jgi:hypothetical protein
MINIELGHVGIGFADTLDAAGNRIAIVIYQDPKSGISVSIPHDAKSSRQVAAHLEGRPVIEIAGTAPPHPMGM